MKVVDKSVEGILFDCDGVLVDSHDAAAVAWDSWASVYAPEFDFRTHIAHGVRVAEMVASLVNADALEAAIADLDNREFESAWAVRSIAGAVALTNSIPQHRWAVVTSATRRIAHSRLAAAGHRVPDALISAEDVERGKPDPMPFLRGAELLGYPPAQCVVFEDAPAGIAAARAAGVGVVVGVGDHLGGTEVDHHVDDLRFVKFEDGALILTEESC